VEKRRREIEKRTAARRDEAERLRVGGRRGKTPPRPKAFTLVEVLISVLILSIALLAIFRGNVINLRSAREARELLTATMAAESVLKEMFKRGYPESGVFEGVFEDEYYKGIKWVKKIEPLAIPGVTDLKTVSVTVEYGKGRLYTLETVLSRY
jgi:prepilin-type N-terminal cleavage/methylation domain-containing protein